MFASLACVAGDLGKGGGGDLEREKFGEDSGLDGKMSAASLMQVDCQNFLPTNIIQVVSTTFTKSVNTKLHQA